MTGDKPIRPTTTEELGALFSKVFKKEEREQGLAFKPRSGDIIITPFAKCGTTWLQQIAHGLRTRGSMDFEEISDVTPWIETAAALGIDLHAPQLAEPRVFKSHLNWHDVPRGARYIVSFRAPLDALISLHRFFEGFFFEPGAIDLEAFSDWHNPPEEMGESGYWLHLASWWEQRNNPDVLLLCYEDMVADLPNTVRRIAAFMDIPLDDELFDCVVRQASRPFMLAHKEQFGEAPVRRLMARRAGLPVEADAYKVTPGPRDSRKQQPSPALHQQLDELWQAQVQARCGVENYEALRHAVRGLHQAA